MANPSPVAPKLAVSPAPFTPYLAPLLVKGATKERDKALATTIGGLLKTSVTLQTATLGDKTRTPSTPGDPNQTHGLWISTFTYSQEATPAWADAATGLPRDVTNHLVVVAVKGDRAAICASDTSIYPTFLRGLAGVAEPLDRTTMENAFVGVEAKAIWLNGVHTPTAVKPSAKTLMGSALEYALDPLGDQTFYYSAIRSQVTFKSGGASARRVVGVAPGNARLWIGRPKDWDAFVVALEEVIDHASSGHAQPTNFKALAQAVSDFTGTGAAYAVAVMPPELLSEGEVDPEERETAVEWAYNAVFEVIATAGPSVTLKVNLGELDLGDLEVTVTPGVDKHEIAGAWTRKAKDKDEEVAKEQLRQRAAGLAFLIQRRWIRIYYENGHTLAQERLYLPTFRDELFAWEPRGFAGYDIHKEKPAFDKAHPLVSCIALKDKAGKDDKSLFAYVVQKMFHKGGSPHGWLASDDGSMEFADFVHIDPDDKVATLVHVKAANSKKPGRQVSVSAFEIVVGQAIKNLRHLDHAHLAEALEAGAHKQIGGAVWHNGNAQPDRSAMITAAKALPRNYTRHLVILQPQLTEKERKDCDDGTVTLGRQQRKRLLDTLLNGARATANNVGAKFTCYSCK